MAVEAEEIEEAEGDGDTMEDEDIYAAAGITREELAVCISVLQRLAAAREEVDWRSRSLREFRRAVAPHHQAFAHLPQKDAIDARQRAKRERDLKRERRQRQLEADQRWKENAQLRRSRLEKLRALEEAGDGGSAEYVRQQSCYTCKARFLERHHFYSHLCPTCADLNFVKRNQHHDLRGRICLVTGARVKIGFETALKLLRMGARVLATTRFPQDARRRYEAEHDASNWSDRLEIFGVDFRFLRSVEAFCENLISRNTWLDVLVNNACQTIRRPVAYYQHLLDGEIIDKTHAATAAAVSQGASAVVRISDSSIVDPSSMAESAAMSQIRVLTEDHMTEDMADLALPAGACDAHGQQLDLRARNSWLLRLGEVSTPETVEAFCINTLTPFILNGHLRPLLERSPYHDRYIINVSAMEGKFYRYKQPTHPHTNMAKAALNMMTRTSAEEYATTSCIYMNSVDTGWINDENPLPTASRIAADHSFQTPIDEIDAAARILDPVLTGMKIVEHSRCHLETENCGDATRMTSTVCQRQQDPSDSLRCPVSGQFLKDYQTSEW